MNQMPPFRRTRAHISQFTISQLHLRNPWVISFFAFSYPGFGHLLLHRYAAAFILITWEAFINNMANVNLGILYSLLGDFETAKKALDEKWLMLYVGIYMFSIWDSYRVTVDHNKLYLLADREDAPIPSLNIGSWDINSLGRCKPWIALAWSFLMPGLGHLYIHKILTGFFVFGYTITVLYFGHIPQAIQFTMVGEFAQAKQIINMQWAMYLPSIYVFIVYDSYVSAVEYNKLFEKELSNYLRRNYQNPNFKPPI